MGEFKFNKMKQMMENSGKDLDASMKELFEWSKHNFNHSDSSRNATSPQDQPITKAELQELLDRSEACYQNTDDSKFNNITIFETTNNLDK